MTPKDILTNPAFCPVPWTGLMYNFNGEVKNCIRSSDAIGNIQDNSIEQIVYGPTNMHTQFSMANKTPAKNCQPCYNLDQNQRGFDHISDRVFYIRELKTVPTETYQLQNFDLQTIDVRWTNLCNFACVYCYPQFSSRWSDELGVTHQTPTEEQRQEFKEYILRHASQLKHVYMAGGEPLLMRENLELLDILKKENPDVNLRINTNLSKTDTRVFDRICEFKNVHWTVSVESCGKEFEYIRHGGSWQDFTDNLNTIQKLNHKITFNMLHFLLNYLSIFDCVDYLKSLGFHNNAFVIGALLTPEYLNIRHLPEDVLYSVQTNLEQRINEQPGFLLENGYRNMLNYIQEPFEKNFEESIRQLAVMDQRRKLDSSKIFKDLYNIKENYHG
jgi:sulfatase maturation enzyme AslB (radical SAM superfamily)